LKHKFFKMRVRLPFAGSSIPQIEACTTLADIPLGAFLFFLATAGYAGLSALQVDAMINDKLLHFLTFFILTTCFYWILDTSRRRTLHLTLLICTGVLGVGSEILQGFLPNGRNFDLYDIVANIVGSLLALALSTWYHMRMLERKRLAKHYQVVPGDEEADLELGEGVGAQETGIAHATNATLDQEVENWDENAEDAWDEEHATESVEGDGPKTPSASSAGEAEAESKKRKE
jgi:VanZ family protein